MRRTLRNTALASVVAIGGLMGLGTTSAQAQGFGVFGSFGVYPGNSYFGGGYGGGGYSSGYYGGGYGGLPVPMVGIGGYSPYGGYGGGYGGYAPGYGGYGGGGYGPRYGAYGGSPYGHHHHRHHRGCGHY